MGYDVIIRNGSFLQSDGAAKLSVGTQDGATTTIGIEDGLIAAIEEEIDGVAAEEIDAEGLHVLPGVVDAHVHFNEPGRAEWEGIATGSAALAAGGGTCFFDMPLNSSPPTLDAASFDLKRSAAEGQAVTDFGLWGGLVPGNVDRLDELAERGVVGFKAFMSDSGMSDFERADDATLFDGMARAARLDLPVAVHAENDSITRALAARAVAEGRTAAHDYLRSRPVIAEVEAITRAILMAEETGCSLHVVHVSSGRGLTAVAEARRRGVDVTCETCPHYLLLSDEDVERLGAPAKCAPPLRSRDDVEALWQHVLRGDVDLIASDHSPAPPSMKQADSLFDVWGGIAGCQTMLSILLAEGQRDHGASLARLVELVTRAPAQRFRIWGKGRIEVGCDADLVLVDLQGATPLLEADLFYRHPISPYLGRRVHGLVRRTLVRSRTVFVDGALTGIRPGRLVKPTSA